jgi:hypothetical protein
MNEHGQPSEIQCCCCKRVVARHPAPVLQDAVVTNVMDGTGDGVEPKCGKNEKSRSDTVAGGCGEAHADCSSSTNNDTESIHVPHSAMRQGMRLSKGRAELEGTDGQGGDAVEDVNVDGGRGGQKGGDQCGAAQEGVGEGGAAAATVYQNVDDSLIGDTAYCLDHGLGAHEVAQGEKYVQCRRKQDSPVKEQGC